MHVAYGFSIALRTKLCVRLHFCCCCFFPDVGESCLRAKVDSDRLKFIHLRKINEYLNCICV